jgi:hypothetical protein
MDRVNMKVYVIQDEWAQVIHGVIAELTVENLLKVLPDTHKIESIEYCEMYGYVSFWDVDNQKSEQISCEVCEVVGESE